MSPRDLTVLWNSGATVKQATRVSPLSKEVVVKTFRKYARKYGYSGSIPVKQENRRPYAPDWGPSGVPGIQYSRELNRYWDGKTVRDEQSAEWAGWIGKGATLRAIINGNVASTAE